LDENFACQVGAIGRGLPCDFFTKKVWTLTGLKTYILFFIHIGTRRVTSAASRPSRIGPG